MFSNSSGAVVAVVGGIVYPLVYNAQFLPNFHIGYSIVALSVIPILLLTSWVFNPKRAEKTNTAGFIGSHTTSTATAADDD